MEHKKIKAKIMYLEDETDAICVMAEFLNLRGLAVIPAHTCGEAHRKLKEHNPHLILVDLKLDNQDGLDFIREIRREGIETPVIVITAYPERMAEITLKDLNIYALYIKPISYEALYKTIAEILEIC